MENIEEQNANEAAEAITSDAETVDEGITATGEEPEKTPAESMETDEQAPRPNEPLYQTKYQDALGRLDETDPTGHLRSIATGEVSPTEQPPPQQDGEPLLVSDMTQDQLAGTIGKMVREQTTMAYQQVRQRESIAQASNQAWREIAAVQDGDATLNPQVLQQLASIGIDPQRTWPTQFARAYIERLQTNAISAQEQGQVNDVTASTQAKVDALKQVQQPVGASPPAPQKLSANMQRLKQMQDAGSSEAAKEVFGS